MIDSKSFELFRFLEVSVKLNFLFALLIKVPIGE